MSEWRQRYSEDSVRVSEDSFRGKTALEGRQRWNEDSEDSVEDDDDSRRVVRGSSASHRRRGRRYTAGCRPYPARPSSPAAASGASPRCAHGTSSGSRRGAGRWRHCARRRWRRLASCGRRSPRPACRLQTEEDSVTRRARWSSLRGGQAEVVLM